MKISFGTPAKGQLILVLYATPTRPGWCRHIGCQILIKDDAGKLPPGLGFFALPIPDWLGHVLASLFLHQDLVFLHYQERTLGQKGARSLAKGSIYAQSSGQNDHYLPPMVGVSGW